MVDMGWDTVSMGVIPIEVQRSLDPLDNIVFVFTGSNEILPGETTAQLDIQTNAGGFGSGTLVFDTEGGGMVDAFTAFQPSGILPEPSSLALLGAGLLPVIGVIRRRYLNR